MSANCWRAAAERGPAVKSFDIHFDKEGDTMNVLITGAGRREALGYNLVRRCLERGDTVIATVCRPSEALAELWRADPERLHVLTMDIASSESVRAAATDAAKIVPCIDLMINNAVTTSPDCGKEFMQTNLDYIAGVIDVGAVGPLRVIQAWMPLLEKSASALVVNISSEAGSIGACYRTSMIDYAMAKAALNMATMTLHNAFADKPALNILCVHPGWMRTNAGNAEAPLLPYEHAQTLLDLFEFKRTDKTGPVFVDYTGKPYPW